MTIRVVPESLFSYLMGRVSGTRFESFVKQIFSNEFSEDFIPLGGIHDGGADGAISSFIQEVTGKQNTYIQFTTTAEKSVKTKIYETIQSLQSSGRNPRQLIYTTSIAIPKSDVIVQDAFEKLSVMVQFRDYERIKCYINSEMKNNKFFYDFFSSEISALHRAASNNLTAVNEYATDPTVYVFLNYELKTKNIKNHLNEQVLDALIYWSLRDTDPEKETFKARNEIQDSIAKLFPQARAVLLPNLEKRLSFLIKKNPSNVERIRYYKKEGNELYCLPYEMRNILATEASDALARQTQFSHSIQNRLSERIENAEKDTQKATCNKLVFKTVHRYFIEQGILLAAFLEGKLENSHVSDQIVEDIMVNVLAEIEHAKSISPTMFGACLAVLRGIFYNPTSEEREYMAYLSKTSCLLVTMQSAPKLLEYFNKMGGNFRLLIGTDMIIKAISERYLESESQQVTKIIQICKQLGSEIMLTEPVLDEVFTHLHASDLEFRNHYSQQEVFIDKDTIIDSDRIMIRAYFHSRKLINGPKSWFSFIEQMVTHSALRNKTEQARQELKGFLIQKFNMKFLSQDELKSSVNEDKVKELAEKLDDARQTKHMDLSYNDALMAYATYSQRRRNNESGIYDGFGFRTWWLTKETHVLAFSKGLLESEGGVPYIMRPEFLLNFVSLSANAENVRKTFANLLPTTAGLQLGKHLSAETMHQLIGSAEEWGERPPERVSIIINERINNLKHNQFKLYSDNID
ncbi:hypothetical protein ACI51Z_11520 [Pectobacterium carotovorum]|uniref:hypothetical protein n=1 Tax=Pectobacterium carotovorum TaxID=554 RepID=UPI0038672ACB